VTRPLRVVVLFVVATSPAAARQNRPEPGTGRHAGLLGSQPPMERTKIAGLRDAYLREQALRGFAATVGPTGPHEGIAVRLSSEAAPVVGCVREICTLAGSTACTSDDALVRIARSCTGSYSGGCIRAACAGLGALACAPIDTTLKVAEACRGNFGGACIQAACQLLGGPECSSRPTVLRLVQSCRGNFDDGCLRSVCARAGVSACGQVDDVAHVAEACGQGT
jgi:hypothetical protein